MEETLLIKISSPSDVNFYEEHMSVVRKYGFVDFAKIGRSPFSIDRLVANEIYIRDNKAHGNLTVKASIEKTKDDKRFPKYYENLDLSGAVWIRLTNMEIIDFEKCLRNYVTRNDTPITRAVNSMAPVLYIHERQQEE